MNAVVESKGSVSVVSLEGEIDLYHSGALRETLAALLEQKRPAVVLNLKKVTYIDSSGLAVLIEALQKVNAYGGKFILCGLRPEVYSVLAMARLDRIFTVVATEAQALRQVR